MEFNYTDIEELIALEDKIGNKDKVGLGDPDVTRYNFLVEKYSKSHFDFSDLVEYTREMKKGYEAWCDEHVQEETESLREQLKKAERRLQKIADAIRPYITESEEH